MAARKTSPGRKRTTSRTTKRTTSRRAGPLAQALGRIELPPTLRDYVQRVEKRLDRLERDVTRAQLDARRRAARLLREASRQLGRLEVRGEAGWRRLTTPYRRQLVDLLRRLEKAVSPPSQRKTGARKKATRRKATARKKTAAAR